MTIASIYILTRDSTTTHYKTADTEIQHCIQHITNIPHSVLTGAVNALSTLWHSYTDDHRGQQIADVISNSDHITLNTNTPTRVPNTTLQHLHQISPRRLTHYTIGHRGQHNTHYHHNHNQHTTWLQTTTKPTGIHQRQESWLDTIYGRHRVRFRSDHHTHQYTHCQHNFHKHHTDGRQAQYTKGQYA